MTEAQKRLNEIRTLIKEHNISTGMLKLVAGKTQAQIHKVLRSTNHSISEENYKLFLDAINTIQKFSEEELYQKYVRGSVQPKREINNQNINAIREFLEENNIKLSTAAAICGYTRATLDSLLGRTKKHDITNEKKNEILTILKSYFAEQNKK